MGLSGDNLAAFSLFAGFGVSFGLTSLTVGGRLRLALRIIAGLFFVASVAVALTAWRVDWAQVSVWAYAATPPLIVGLVALMLRARQAPASTVSGLSRAEVEALVRTGVESVVVASNQDGSTRMREMTVVAALEAIAAPVIAQAKLPRVREIRVRRAGPPESFVNAEQSRRQEVLHDCDFAHSQVMTALVEAGSTENLPELLKRAETLIMGDSKYISQLPTDPVQWPSGEEKRRWHLVEARADILERAAQQVLSQLENAAKGNGLHMDMALRDLKEQMSRRSPA